MQQTKRVCVNLTNEQADALKERAVVTSVPQSEQILRAINLSLFADQQGARKAQPVLIPHRSE